MPHPPSELVDLVVADAGQGIAEAFLPHVFERFRQEDPRTMRARRPRARLAIG